MRSLAVVAVLLALPVASAHAGRIEVNRGIAGVELGMTLREVRDRLGPPTTRTPHRGTIVATWRSRAIGVATRPGTTTVWMVTTSRPRHRTRSGIGVGSTRRAVRRALPRAICSPAACVAGRFPGRRTSFQLDAGRVSAVSVLARQPG